MHFLTGAPRGKRARISWNFPDVHRAEVLQNSQHRRSSRLSRRSVARRKNLGVGAEIAHFFYRKSTFSLLKHCEFVANSFLLWRAMQQNFGPCHWKTFTMAVQALLCVQCGKKRAFGVALTQNLHRERSNSLKTFYEFGAQRAKKTRLYFPICIVHKS